MRGKPSVIEIQSASLLPAVMSEQRGWQGMVPVHSRTLQSSGRRKKFGLCRSHWRCPADGWAESDVNREKQGAKGGNITRAKGRQLKIHICVKLEWGHAHTCQTPQLSHPVHTQQREWCGVQVQLFISLCLCLYTTQYTS